MSQKQRNKGPLLLWLSSAKENGSLHLFTYTDFGVTAMNDQLKRYSVIGTVFVLLIGTLSHFLYEWTGNNFLAGFLVPVNESTWEHMKLLFFPMLLYSFFMMRKLKRNDRCIVSALFTGILVGTLLIPVIFYTYTGILGYNLFIFDLLTFALSVIAAFFVTYRLSSSCRMQKYCILLCSFIFILTICFFVFTYCHPSIGLFAVPYSGNS